MLLTISKFFWYCSLLSVVVVMPSTFFPFIGGKYYFFRVCVEFALMFFLFWWSFEATTRDVKARVRHVFSSPLFLSVSAFALAFVLASVFAHNPHSAFWSNFERGEGGFQMLHYLAFFVLSCLLFQEEKEWKRVFWVSMAAAGAMILYGVLAAVPVSGFIGPYFSGGQDAPSVLGRLFFPNARFQGSLGNPAYVAPYLMFALFYALWLWVRGPKNWQRGLLYGGSSFIFLLFFILSQTRGAFIGLLAALLVFFLYLVFAHARTGKLQKKVFIGFVLCIIAGGALFMARDAEFVKKIPGGRLLDIGFSTDTFQTRFWTWGSAWEGFKERPIFGWGPENFSTVFDKHFDPRHFQPGKNSETWFDRAHSIFFDYLTETGLVGLAAYVSMFVIFYLHALRRHGASLKESVEKRLMHIPAAGWALLVAMPVGYLVQGMILFDVLPIYLNLFLFFAFATYLLTTPKQSS